MKKLLLSILAVGCCGISNAQVAKTSDHPFFKAMLGECVEEAKLLLPGAKEALDMKVTMKLQPALGGVWVQEDGKAVSSQFSFTFRWMFRVVAQESGQVVIGRFIDSNGQIQEYVGEFKDEMTLILRRKTKDGNYMTTVAQTGENKWSINTLFQPAGADKPIAIYQGVKTRSAE